MACGIDIGTCWIVGARQDANAQIQIKSIRDAFLIIENESAIKTMLTMSNVNYVESDENLYIIGDSSLVMASLLKRPVQRPMSNGVLASGEKEAEKILLLLLENVLGKAHVQGEICFYSVPGNPLERDMDIIYHQAKLSGLLGQLGYKAQHMNEAAAIAFSNAAKEQFSALTISAGAGMLNVCLMYKTMIGMSYSIINSGDWVDESAAKAVGSSPVRLQAIKEKGIDLMNPAEGGDPRTIREREAISIYYKSLILRLLDSLKIEFIKNKKADFELPCAIPMIISGGTSKAKNFLEFFKAAFDTVKNFPIPVSEIRMASDPLNAVAQGLLVAALNAEASKK